MSSADPPFHSDPTTTTSTHPDVPPLPPPSTFSILPDLYLLLACLAPVRQTQTSSILTQTASNTSQSTQPSLPTSGAQPSAHPSANPFASDPPALTPTISNEPAIQPKDLPSLIYPIKQHILKAKAAIESLPDIERSPAEQEAEIRMLQGRIGGLRGRLGELGRIAGRGVEGQNGGGVGGGLGEGREKVGVVKTEQDEVMGEG